MHYVEQSSTLSVPAASVWTRAITEEGINDELSPVLKMTMPAGLRGRTIDDLDVGVPLGRSWILLGGVLPVDCDDLLLAELEPGTRFLERSRTLAFSVWQHERIIVSEGDGCRVTDRLSFELKGVLRTSSRLAAVATAIVRALFRHRHARLRRHHGA